MHSEAENNLCPLTGNPYEDCYCFDMNSQKIFKALFYCCSAFEDCEVYIKHSQAGVDLKHAGKGGNGV